MPIFDVNGVLQFSFDNDEIFCIHDAGAEIFSRDLNNGPLRFKRSGNQLEVVEEALSTVKVTIDITLGEKENAIFNPHKNDPLIFVGADDDRNDAIKVNITLGWMELKVHSGVLHVACDSPVAVIKCTGCVYY